MIKQLLSQSLNGFTLQDLPFLFVQIITSAILAWIIRVYWRRNILTNEEKSFLNYLIPFQIILTTIAVFSHQSPWMMIVFGLFALIPVLGNNGFNLLSRFYYTLIIFIALGCGAANLVVTVLITIILIIPFLHLFSIKSENE